MSARKSSQSETFTGIEAKVIAIWERLFGHDPECPVFESFVAVEPDDTCGCPYDWDVETIEWVSSAIVDALPVRYTKGVWSTQIWSDIRDAVDAADAIAWDGCHKIYVSMDKTQTEVLRDLGYMLHEADKVPRAEMQQTIKMWVVESCKLRFVSTVSTLPNGDADFVSVLPQSVRI
jgi:hypothetical protein